MLYSQSDVTILLPLALTCSCAAACTLATELEAMHWYTPASEVTRPRMRRLVPRTIWCGRRGLLVGSFANNAE